MRVVTTRVGDAAIHQIVEYEIGPEVEAIFDDASLETFSKIPSLFPAYVTPEGAMTALSQSFVVTLGRRVLVVDTCIGNDKERLDLPQWGRLQTTFLAGFAEIGLTPDDVTDVLCTHLHIDHVGWNTTYRDSAWQPTFKNAKYYFARAEYDHIATGAPGLKGDTLRGFADSVRPVVEAGLAVLVEPDADLGDGIALLPTPGHTIGHVSVRLRLGAEQLFISGDAIHHPCQLARPDWSTNIDFDPLQAARSRKDLLARASAPDALLAGTHFSLPSIGRVSPAGDGSYGFAGRACAHCSRG